MKVMVYLYSAIECLIPLFYPSTCIVCEKNLLKEGGVRASLRNIPKTDCFRQAKNSVSKLFWGIIHWQNTVVLCQFQLLEIEGVNVSIATIAVA